MDVEILLEKAFSMTAALCGNGEKLVKRHCDEYIDDEASPAPLRRYLERARSPAHGLMSTVPFPRLYATRDGNRVRVVMASRMGHVGITRDLQVEYGYEEIAFLEELSNFADAP